MNNIMSLTAARAWADINGIIFLSLGLWRWFLGSKMEDSSSKNSFYQEILFLGIVLIFAATLSYQTHCVVDLL